MTDLERRVRDAGGPDRHGVTFDAVHGRANTLRRRKTIRWAATAGATSAALVVGVFGLVQGNSANRDIITTTAEASEAPSEQEIITDLASDERALFDAIRDDDIRGVRALVDSGTNLEARSPNGLLTPLMVAAFRGSTDMVKVLLEGGADPAAVNQAGDTAVEVAARAGAAETWLELVTFQPVTQVVLDRSLIAAALSSDAAMVELVIDSGADLRVAGGDALLIAVQDTPSVDVIVALVGAGVNPDLEASGGEVPRSIARDANDPALLDALGQTQ